MGRICLADIIAKEHVPFVVEVVKSLAREGWKEALQEVLCRTKHGKEIWVEVKFRSLGRGRVALIARDITAKKELEERLVESEEMFRIMAERSLVGIYLIQDGVFKYVNPKMAELWGYGIDEIVGRSPVDFVHPDDREMVKRNIELRISGKVEYANYKVRIVRKNGEVRINEVYGSRMIFKGKPAIIGTLVDITDEVKMRREVERLNKLLQILNEIGQLIAREKDIDVLLDKAVEKLSKFYDLAAICHGDGRVRCHSSANIKPEFADLPSGSVVEFVDGGLHTLIIPMRHEDEVIGRLILQSKTGFSRRERELLLTLADDLAFAVNAARTEEEKWIAFEQIEKNIEQFAILVDQIRNPLAAISLITELEIHGKAKEKILEQIRRIDALISMLDKGWLESEKISRYLRRIW